MSSPKNSIMLSALFLAVEEYRNLLNPNAIFSLSYIMYIDSINPIVILNSIEDILSV